MLQYSESKEKLAETYVRPSELIPKSESEQSNIKHLCVMSMEILALVRPGMPVPDPSFDEVNWFVYFQSNQVFIGTEVEISSAQKTKTLKLDNREANTKQSRENKNHRQKRNSPQLNTWNEQQTENKLKKWA